jgi:hypothetical protein
VRVCTPGMTAEEIITAADKVLYEAKHLGRNQMVSKVDEPIEPVSAVAPSLVLGDMGS